MAIYHNGYNNIDVKLESFEGNSLAERVYMFGRYSHDFYDGLPDKYDEKNPDCIKLIDKIIEGTTLPKFAFVGTRMEFSIKGISRICLAQITRDPAIFASASTGVFPLTQEFNIPMSIYNNEEIMADLKEAQKILERAYVKAVEAQIPMIEARYIGLHSQIIDLHASYTPLDFRKACYSRTSSNFCDECNYVYRLMYRELVNEIKRCVTDTQSRKLWNWLLPEEGCINDRIYKRERLFNSDFLPMLVEESGYKPNKPALMNWKKSGWKKELERMAVTSPELLTDWELKEIANWKVKDMPTTYDSTAPDVGENLIKTMDYYKEAKNGN